MTETNFLRSIIFPNAKYQKDIVPKPAEYNIPPGLKYDDVSINESLSGWENRFTDRMIGLEMQQNALGQTVQQSAGSRASGRPPGSRAPLPSHSFGGGTP